MVSHFIIIVLADKYPLLPWPRITEQLLRPNGWILMFPLPWLIYAAALSRRRELSPGTVFIFLGTVVLGLAIMVCVVAFASLLPYVELYMHFDN
jgi:hypothetical protein